MTLEPFERAELQAFLSMLRMYLAATVETHRGADQDVADNARDLIASVDRWIERLAVDLPAAAPATAPRMLCDCFLGGFQSTPIRCALPAGHVIKPESDRGIHAGFASDGALVTFGGAVCS